MIKVQKSNSLIIFLISLSITAVLSGCGSKKEMIASKDDLPGKRIGVQLGTTGETYAEQYERPFSSNTPVSQIERYSNSGEALLALKQGNVDCVIIDEPPAKAYTSKNDDLMILDDTFDVEEYAIAFSKDETELRDSVNEALARLKSSGTLDEIIDHYGENDEGGGYTCDPDTEHPNGTLRVATSAAFKPYEYYSNSRIVGIDIDIINAICDDLGYELELMDMDFDSILDVVKYKKADCAISGITVTKERKEQVIFSNSYTTAKQVIVVPAEK
ncbi:MAG: transporter substrate-binding domain-containing protein [Lachnospiraceae bacterium]|nr:transporter substrate-binding domain-containing protein [Lachnospiraceae bacterium]